MKKLIVILSLILLNCQSSKTDSTKIENTSKTSSNDTLSIDLVELKSKGLLNKTQQIEIKNDVVFHKDKRFNAIDFEEILNKYSSIENLNPAETKIVFECEDGYKPEMPLEKLLSAKSYLAISDVDAPKGSEWEQIMKDGHEMKAAPFYLIYPEIDQKNNDYQKPYNLVAVHLAPLNQNDAALFPKNDESVVVGYNLFKKHCQTCHAINKIGGVMGPELNYPKSVTEYWKIEDLEAFIVNPASYRNGVKMPNLGIKPAESKEIVRYLEYMSK
jgi:cytochrome c2